MEETTLTEILYQENLKWVYSIIKELEEKEIEKKQKYICDPYILNNLIVLGYYFMNLYVVSNYSSYDEKKQKELMSAIIDGASNYNKTKLDELFKKDVELSKLINQYNTVVRKTKTYSPNDGLKARIVAADEIYRRIYDKFNKQHFSAFIKVILESFGSYENRIEKIINKYYK